MGEEGVGEGVPDIPTYNRGWVYVEEADATGKCESLGIGAISRKYAMTKKKKCRCFNVTYTSATPYTPGSQPPAYPRRDIDLNYPTPYTPGSPPQ